MSVKKPTPGKRTRLPPRLGGTALAAVAVLLLGGAPCGAAEPETHQGSLAGRLLVAAPGMGDPRFRETVVLVVRHDSSGAFGLVVNRVLGRARLSEILGRFGLPGPKGAGEIPVHYGGPVQPELFFALHSTERELPDMQRVAERIALSPGPAVLRAIARGEGPRRTVFAMGYAGWGPGQLDAEMGRGDWFTAPAEEDLVFDESHETKWPRAMARRFRTL